MSTSDDGDGRQAASFVAFSANTRIAWGSLAEVAVSVWRALEMDPDATALVFDADTGEVVDLDLRGGGAAIRARLAPPPAAPARGRPRLGVVSREVTLLPRHWAWLARQPGGASVTLRRLVEEARRADAAAPRRRVEAAYRFMSAIGGDLPGFEEAARALFAHDRARLESRLADWPIDVRDQALRFVDGGRSSRSGS
jgi:hypothetical protein